MTLQHRRVFYGSFALLEQANAASCTRPNAFQDSLADKMDRDPPNPGCKIRPTLSEEVRTSEPTLVCLIP